MATGLAVWGSVALLLTLSATVVQAAKNAPVLPRKAPKFQFCNDLPAGSTAAVDALLKQAVASPCSDFIKGVKDWNLQNELRQASRGKVILCPSNYAMQERFMFKGLYLSPPKIPASAMKAFRDFVRTGVAVKRSSIPIKAGCGALYLEQRKGGLASGRIRMIQTNQHTKAAAVTEYQYSVLGQGYNAYIGFPVSFGMSAMDPGFTMVPIFDLTPDNVRSLAATGGGCQSQFSSTTYTSAKDTKTAVAGSVSLGVASSAWSFSASVSMDYLSSASTTSQTITVTSTAKVFLGGYGLTSGPGSLILSKGFLQNLVPLMTAASEDKYDPTSLAALVDNYGTHYIKSVWFGGLASVIQQMTSQSKAQLDKLGVTGNIGVKLGKQTTLDIQGNVTYNNDESSTEENLSETFSQILIPSAVPIPVTQTKYATNSTSGAPAPTFIDCVAWTTNLKDAMDDPARGWKAPISYSLSPIQAILSIPALFPSDWAPVLPAMARQIDTYINGCGYSASNFSAWTTKRACPTPIQVPDCVTGTYKSSSGGCNTCFGDGTVVGPNCNATYTVSCTPYSCYCMPKYATNTTIAGVFCTPLANNPPAPPAPSMSQLVGRRLRSLL